MMGKKFATIVENCLHRLDQGEDLPEILADYPALAEQLKPLLLVAMASRALSVPVPNQTARRVGRREMLGELDRRESKELKKGQPLGVRIRSWFFALANALRAQTLVRQAPSYHLALAGLMLAFGVGLFTISVSASDLPGGMLGSFAADVQQALGILDQDLSEQDRSFPAISLLAGADLYPGGTRAAKVAFLIDLLENPQAVQFSDHGQNQDQENGQEDDVEVEEEEGEDEVDPLPEDPGIDNPDDLPETSSADFAPGQQDGPAMDYAPGQQDGPARDYAPGQVKKLVDGAEDQDQNKDDQEKDNKGKKNNTEKEKGKGQAKGNN